ncbi:aldose 1-epimerase [Polaribacter cellanae]|uniref:Aldose 1-epimerase n=1 Tax=Polaribacter cellanae TaxID=2818493 RepID=A0A975CQI0_9FLAO|nr:aldose 1-epimerase [Polaribacter cellanae]QTE21356.1 aldose 1-epimerase [Polaribacter cellanae]
MKDFIKLSNKNSVVTIEKGELISFKVDEKEYIHQKGSKGWRKSDDEMFPIIGPISKNNFRVHTKKGDAIQDQHGLLRELEYSLISLDENSAKFSKKYVKNTKVINSKYPEKSTEKELFWPFDFTFEKHFSLENNTLKIDFTIISEEKMPFMLGYHPAFLLSNTGKDTLVANDKKITLEEIYEAGHNAFPVLNTNTIILENSDRNHLEITTKNFHNFMLWTAVDNMLCIEPITQYTSYTDEKFSEGNMRISSGKEAFSVTIKVL